MSRLNKKACNILKQQVEFTTKNNLAGDIQREIVLKRLDALSLEEGTRVKEIEISGAILDIIPDFPEKTVKKAAKINQPMHPAKKVSLGLGILGLGIVGMSGIIWVVNLPYPMIRRPVARVAPILLLPSFLDMDHNYRSAISNVEQADQLVNSATGPRDIQLGNQKVAAAQKNLDQLPVWFLGYEPLFMCSYMSCSWHFTFDEFQAARMKIGRMQAKVFQETNALTQLNTAQTQIDTTVTLYKNSTTSKEKEIALANWQNGLDKLNQLYPNTLASRLSQPQITAYQRDFSKLSGQVALQEQTSTFIGAAKQFNQAATEIIKKPPITASRWQQAMTLQKQAIERLEKVSSSDAGYPEAQTLLAKYQSKLGEIQIRTLAEEDSVKAIDTAKTKIESLMAQIPDDPQKINRNKVSSQLQGIIDQLQKVQPNTSVYSEAQLLLTSAKQKLSQL